MNLKAVIQFLIISASFSIRAMDFSGIELKSFVIEKEVLESISTEREFGARNIYMNRRCKAQFGQDYKFSGVVSRSRLEEIEPSLFFYINNSARRFFGLGERSLTLVEQVIYNILCSKSSDPVELTAEQSAEYFRMLDEEYEIVRKQNRQNTQINDSSRDSGSSRNNNNHEIIQSEITNGR